MQRTRVMGHCHVLQPLDGPLESPHNVRRFNAVIWKKEATRCLVAQGILHWSMAYSHDHKCLIVTGYERQPKRSTLPLNFNSMLLPNAEKGGERYPQPLKCCYYSPPGAALL
eukprot:2032623-Amphidinium_carterae.1